MHPNLLSHQTEPVRILTEILRERDLAIDCSEAGLGKTYVALGVATELQRDAVVVCPKSLIPPWYAAAKYMGVHARVANYERARKDPEAFFAKHNNDLVIFDEAHRCKGTTSANSKLMLFAFKRKLKVLAMSATLAQNPLEMKAIGFGLRLHQNYNFYWWCRNNGCYKNYWGGLEFKDPSNQALTKLHAKLFPSNGVRLRKDDVHGFPETQIIAEAYTCDPKAAEVFENLHYDLQALRQSESIEDNPLTVILKARQQAELLKVPLFLELIHDGLEQGQHVAMFVNFRQTLEHLYIELSRRAHVSLLHGDMPSHEREAEVKAFQDDMNQVFICTTATGGVGLSLHDVTGKFPRLALISPTYSAVELVQALGRVHRAGAKSKSLQKIVFAANSVEADVCEKVKRKLNNLSLLNDGDLQDPYL